MPSSLSSITVSGYEALFFLPSPESDTNAVRPAVYGRFIDVLCRDLVTSNAVNPSGAKQVSPEPFARGESMLTPAFRLSQIRVQLLRGAWALLLYHWDA